MKRRAWVGTILMLLILPGLAWAGGANAGAAASGALDLNKAQGQLTPYVRLLVELSLLSFVPAALVAMTSFTRVIIP